MKQYALPPLGYGYDALAPVISAEIMELHHSKHHENYVSGANEVLLELEDAREHDDFTRISALEKALAFNVSGHVLHSIFWQNLTPKGGGQPGGELKAAITRDFGNFDAFKHQLVSAATTLMGSGWAALVWEPLGGRLLTAQIYDHQSNTNQGSVPLLVLDAWEHAYYLQYKNEKAKFFEAIWDVWNWEDVAQRYTAAKQASLGRSLPIARPRRNARPS